MPQLSIQSFLGAGEIYFDRLTSAGASQGYNAIGNALQFELSPDAEMKELESRNPANYGQAIAAVTIPKSTKLKFKFSDFDATALEMALMGTSSAINQSAQTVTDKTVTAKEGKYVEIGHRSATVCHLGNIAIRLGRPIRWDPVKEQIVGDTEAAAMQSRPYRDPWKLPTS